MSGFDMVLSAAAAEERRRRGAKAAAAFDAASAAAGRAVATTARPRPAATERAALGIARVAARWNIICNPLALVCLVCFVVTRRRPRCFVPKQECSIWARCRDQVADLLGATGPAARYLLRPGPCRRPCVGTAARGFSFCGRQINKEAESMKKCMQFCFVLSQPL